MPSQLDRLRTGVAGWLMTTPIKRRAFRPPCQSSTPLLQVAVRTTLIAALFLALECNSGLFWPKSRRCYLYVSVEGDSRRCEVGHKKEINSAPSSMRVDFVAPVRAASGICLASDDKRTQLGRQNNDDWALKVSFSPTRTYPESLFGR